MRCLQAKGGRRVVVRTRGLGNVYKGQVGVERGKDADEGEDEDEDEDDVQKQKRARLESHMQNSSGVPSLASTLPKPKHGGGVGVLGSGCVVSPLYAADALLPVLP